VPDSVDEPSVEEPSVEEPVVPIVETPPEAEQSVDQRPDDSAASSDPIDANACLANSLSSLSSCVQAARSNTLERDSAGIAHISLSSDITCSRNCCPSGQALLNLSDTNGIELNGRGFRVLRSAGQRSCSLLTAHDASNVTVSNIVLDDDETVNACVVNNNCPRMLFMSDATNVALIDTTVRHSKGYAIYVRSTNGFRFEDSVLESSGVLGLYIGHEDQSSRNITVARSRFSDNSTNALALLGVTGPAVVTDNVFERNHAFGQWPVAPQFGTGMTGGGQVYIARASGVRMENNRVVDGYCNNCYVHRLLGTGVTGIELGKPGSRTVSDILINNNVIENNDAYGVAANVTSPIDSTVRVTNNRLRGNGADWRLNGALLQGNTVVD
jgi:hypothetical protein